MQQNNASGQMGGDTGTTLSLKLETTSEMGIELEETPSSSFETIGVPMKVMQQSPKSLIASLPDAGADIQGLIPKYEELQYIRGLIKSLGGVEVEDGPSYFQVILQALRDGAGLVSKIGEGLAESVKYKQGIILVDNENKRLQDRLKKAQEESLSAAAEVERMRRHMDKASDQELLKLKNEIKELEASNEQLQESYKQSQARAQKAENETRRVVQQDKVELDTCNATSEMLRKEMGRMEREREEMQKQLREYKISLSSHLEDMRKAGACDGREETDKTQDSRGRVGGDDGLWEEQMREMRNKAVILSEKLRLTSERAETLERTLRKKDTELKELRRMVDDTNIMMIDSGKVVKKQETTIQKLKKKKRELEVKLKGMADTSLTESSARERGSRSSSNQLLERKNRELVAATERMKKELEELMGDKERLLDTISKITAVKAQSAQRTSVEVQVGQDTTSRSVGNNKEQPTDTYECSPDINGPNAASNLSRSDLELTVKGLRLPQYQLQQQAQHDVLLPGGNGRDMLKKQQQQQQAAQRQNGERQREYEELQGKYEKLLEDSGKIIAGYKGSENMYKIKMGKLISTKNEYKTKLTELTREYNELVDKYNALTLKFAKFADQRPQQQTQSQSQALSQSQLLLQQQQQQGNEQHIARLETEIKRLKSIIKGLEKMNKGLNESLLAASPPIPEDSIVLTLAEYASINKENSDYRELLNRALQENLRYQELISGKQREIIEMRNKSAGLPGQCSQTQNEYSSPTLQIGTKHNKSTKSPHFQATTTPPLSSSSLAPETTTMRTTKTTERTIGKDPMTTQVECAKGEHKRGGSITSINTGIVTMNQQQLSNAFATDTTKHTTHRSEDTVTVTPGYNDITIDEEYQTNRRDGRDRTSQMSEDLSLSKQQGMRPSILKPTSANVSFNTNYSGKYDTKRPLTPVTISFGILKPSKSSGNLNPTILTENNNNANLVDNSPLNRNRSSSCDSNKQTFYLTASKTRRNLRD